MWRLGTVRVLAKEYVEKLSLIVKQATVRRFKDVRLECKHFFSGAALYANGRICISLVPVGLALKLPEKSRVLLLKEKGTKSLRYFPKGPIKKDYVVLPKAMLSDSKVLRAWIKAAIDYALALPRPVKKK